MEEKSSTDASLVELEKKETPAEQSQQAEGPPKVKGEETGAAERGENHPPAIGSKATTVSSGRKTSPEKGSAKRPKPAESYVPLTEDESLEARRKRIAWLKGEIRALPKLVPLEALGLPRGKTP